MGQLWGRSGACYRGYIGILSGLAKSTEHPSKVRPQGAFGGPTHASLGA